jgi:hypothetical protein
MCEKLELVVSKNNQPKLGFALETRTANLLGNEQLWPGGECRESLGIGKV